MKPALPKPETPAKIARARAKTLPPYPRKRTNQIREDIDDETPDLTDSCAAAAFAADGLPFGDGKLPRGETGPEGIFAGHPKRFGTL
jgi:hypothetical protein